MVWDLFGYHLRCVGGGRVPMSALTGLSRCSGWGRAPPGWCVADAPGRLVHHLRSGRQASRRSRPEPPDARPGPGPHLERGREDWDGTWRMVIYVVPEENRAERDLVRRTSPGRVRAAGRRHLDQPAFPAGRRGQRAGRSSATRIDLLECRSHGRDTDLEMAPAAGIWTVSAGTTWSWPRPTSSCHRSPSWPGCPVRMRSGSRWNWCLPTGHCPSATRTCQPGCSRRLAGPPRPRAVHCSPRRPARPG